jgi:hypothetical protein
VSVNNQFGLFDLESLENFHVSKTFLLFSGSPDIILLLLSLTQEIISLIKSTVTSSILLICSCSLIKAELIPIKIVLDIYPLFFLSLRASLN